MPLRGGEARKLPKGPGSILPYTKSAALPPRKYGNSGQRHAPGSPGTREEESPELRSDW